MKKIDRLFVYDNIPGDRVFLNLYSLDRFPINRITYCQMGNREDLEKYISNKRIYYTSSEDITKLEEEGKTTVILAIEKKPVGLFAVADTLKDEAVGVVKSLKKEGLEVWMITGDNEGVARLSQEQVRGFLAEGTLSHGRRRPQRRECRCSTSLLSL